MIVLRRVQCRAAQSNDSTSIERKSMSSRLQHMRVLVILDEQMCGGGSEGALLSSALF